jgi:hypothetical protein
MSQQFGDDISWTQAENHLLRVNFDVTMPGGLSLDLPYKDLDEIARTMNETARAQNISDRVYTSENVWDHYYKNIRPAYDDPDPAKEEEKASQGRVSDPVLARFRK